MARASRRPPPTTQPALSQFVWGGDTYLVMDTTADPSWVSGNLAIKLWRGFEHGGHQLCRVNAADRHNKPHALRGLSAWEPLTKHHAPGAERLGRGVLPPKADLRAVGRPEMASSTLARVGCGAKQFNKGIGKAAR